jgi:DNA-binding response OmpR family regulator
MSLSLEHRSERSPLIARVFVVSEDDADEAERDRPRRENAEDEVLQGKRIFIVEDEFFVALQVESALRSCGCETIGPYTTLDLALQASRREQFDVAILDINLNQKRVYPLADELHMRRIPFVFLTGYARNDLPGAYRSLPRIQKPFDPRMLKAGLKRVLTKMH